MMLIDARTAAYLMAVIQTVVIEGRTDIPLTTTCPECDERVDMFGGYNHISVALTEGTHAVVIGCEGYWIVNPALVGIDSPNWSDWAKLPDDVTPEDFA
jgi:hypothetical protein